MLRALQHIWAGGPGLSLPWRGTVELGPRPCSGESAVGKGPHCLLGGLSALKGGPRLLEVKWEGLGPLNGSGSQKAGPLP